MPLLFVVAALSLAALSLAACAARDNGTDDHARSSGFYGGVSAGLSR
jgi:hypothetical protein